MFTLATTTADSRKYPALLTVKQVAEILGIGRNTAYRLIKERKIVSLRVGRNIKVPMSAIEKFLETAA